MDVYSLRKINQEDLPLLLFWRNQPRVRECMKNNRVITQKQHLSWFENLQKHVDRDSQIFSINNSPVGVVSFTEIDQAVSKKCKWGIYIGDNSVPKGTGYIMGYYGLEYVLKSYTVDNIIAEVFDYNGVSKLFHGRLGFKEIYKKKYLRENVSVEILTYNLKRNDWELNKNNVLKWRANNMQNNDC